MAVFFDAKAKCDINGCYNICDVKLTVSGLGRHGDHCSVNLESFPIGWTFAPAKLWHLSYSFMCPTHSKKNKC